MSVRGAFKVFLYPDPITAAASIDEPEGYEDITEGIINVELVSGADIYEGPQQQIDTGQFTIVSRNPNLDPKINPNIKYNARIDFLDVRNETPAQEAQFYRGYVTDVNVEYQRNDNPIITITGTDIFGVLQRTIVNSVLQEQILNYMATNSLLDGVTLEEFVTFGEFLNLFTSKYYNYYMTTSTFVPSALYGGGEIAASDSFIRFEGLLYSANVSPDQPDFQGLLGYAPARYVPQIGESFLEIINKYNQTNLNYISPFRGYDQTAGFDYITALPFPKYDGNYWSPLNWSPDLPPDIEYDFSFDPVDDAPYESIRLDNGFNNIINQIAISNDYTTVEAGEFVSHKEDFSYSDEDSIVDYAVSRLNISTIVPESNIFSISGSTGRIAKNVFQLVGNPSNQLKSITFNNGRYEDLQSGKTFSFYNLNKTIAIKHKINNDNIISSMFDIAGVAHSISPDKWETTFVLKPNVYDFVGYYQGQTPIIEMNALTGDTNFNFTATLTNYPIEDITSITWCLNAREEGSPPSYYYASTVNGERYKDGLGRFGLTQTWNFDDDGILAPYDAYLNRFGGYGAGYWTVYAYILLNNGFTIAAQQTLTVGIPEVEADFVWDQNLVNNFGQVLFTDTSVNNETGEPDSYLWDFGDGTATSSLKNPIHVYNPSGPGDTEFDVSLTVFAYGEFGAKVYNTKTQTVTLAQPTMVPDFTSSQSQQTITFTNTSTNVGFEEPDAYLWDFGDGTTSTAKNPVKTYAVSADVSISFSVTLTTRNIWEQTASVTKTVTVLALNSSGTFGVRYIKFLIPNYTPPGTVGTFTYRVLTPVMKFLKAVTSGTGANLSYLKPLYNFNDSAAPYPGWYSSFGGNVQQNLGWEYFLTRDPQGLDSKTYGLGAVQRRVRPVRWELVVDLGQTLYTINDLILTFQDFFEVDAGPYYGIHTEIFYERILVQFASTIYGGTYTPNPPGTDGMPTLSGDWITVGDFRVDGGRMDPTKPAGQRTESTKAITRRRPLPLNIPYFLYGFNDKTVNFYSIETADSYLWTFGNGTTATGRDPSVTYADYGTYNVTLQVTTGGVVTRTTTEAVIVRVPWP
jgi:PKD repeat protein